MSRMNACTQGAAARGPARELPQEIAGPVRALVRLRMGRATLLFLAAHAPLAFWAGQALHFAAPALALFAGSGRGAGPVDEWAEFLSRPGGIQALVAALDRDELAG